MLRRRFARLASVAPLPANAGLSPSARDWSWSVHASQADRRSSDGSAIGRTAGLERPRHSGATSPAARRGHSGSRPPADNARSFARRPSPSSRRPSRSAGRKHPGRAAARSAAPVRTIFRSSELAEDGPGQRGVPGQRGMVRILDDTVADQAVRADRGQLAAAVDEDAAGMPAGDLLVGRAEGRRAADRQAVVIEGGEVVAARLGRLAVALEQPSQAKMGFGEARVPLEDRGVTGRGPGRLARLGGAGGLELSTTHCRRSAADVDGRERGPAGLVARLVGRGDDQDRQGADPFAIGDDRLEPTRGNRPGCRRPPTGCTGAGR